MSRITGDASGPRCRASVTQIGIVRRRFDHRQIRMRLRLLLLDGLDVPVDNVARVDDRELGEEKSEFLLVRPGQARFDISGQIPESLLEGAECFLSGLVEKLLVGVARL